MDAVLAALGQWGFGGVLVTLVFAPLGWGIAASSDPGPRWPEACEIVIDPEKMTEFTILHEVGHCVGYFNVTLGVGPRQDHSLDPRSVMNERPGPEITDADRLVVMSTRRWMPYKVRVAF